MRQHKRHDSDWLETLSIAAAVLFVGWFLISATLANTQSEVLDFGPSEAYYVENGEPGAWVPLRLIVKKKRDCALSPNSKLLVTYNHTETPIEAEWSRDGPLLTASEEWQEGRLIFRIPTAATPGRAAAIFDAEFRCTVGSVRQRAPAAVFQILPLQEQDG